MSLAPPLDPPLQLRSATGLFLSVCLSVYTKISTKAEVIGDNHYNDIISLHFSHGFSKLNQNKNKIGLLKVILDPPSVGFFVVMNTGSRLAN